MRPDEIDALLEDLDARADWDETKGLADNLLIRAAAAIRELREDSARLRKDDEAMELASAESCRMAREEAQREAYNLLSVMGHQAAADFLYECFENMTRARAADEGEKPA